MPCILNGGDMVFKKKRFGSQKNRLHENAGGGVGVGSGAMNMRAYALVKVRPGFNCKHP